MAWEEAWSIPVMVSAKAKGLFPEDHPLFGGVFLAQGSAERHILDRADIFVTIGLDRRELLTDWPYEQPTVLLDCIDPDEARLCDPKARAIGNLSDILNALAATGAPKWAAEDVEVARRRIQEQLAPTGPGFWPQQVIEITRRLSPRDSILAIETGIYNMPAEYL